MMNSKGFVAPPFLIWVVVGLLALTLVSKNGVVKFDLSGNRSILQPQNSNIPVPTPNPITDTDLINPVKEFYSNISSKQYDTAWNLLSRNFQNYAQNYDSFVNGYRKTLNTFVKDIRIQDLSDNTVFVQLESSDNINGYVQTKTFEGTWRLIGENGQWKLDSADITLKSVSPTPKPTFAPTPTPSPTTTPMSTPSPISTPNPGKEQALKMIDEKINKINKDIAFLQSQVDGLLKQEEQCSTRGSSLEDPYAQSIAQAQCSQSYFSSISQIQYRINSLIRERNEYERQKIQIMAQP